MIKDKISCSVESIIYRNDKNGYTVCEMRSEKEEFIAVGCLPFVQEGEQIEITGVFGLHPDYGQQFKIDEYVRKSFSTKASIERYLSSGILKGVGEKMAKKMVAKFGLETLEIIKNEPERISTIKGINLEKAHEYSAIIQKKESMQELVLFLGTFDIGQTTCMRIEKLWGENAYSKIQMNPYCLIQPGLGIGFQKADQIAMSLGWEYLSNNRIQSAILTVLYDALYNGNTYLHLDNILQEASKLIGETIGNGDTAFDSKNKDESIVYLKEPGIVSLKLAYQTEQQIAKSIHRRINSFHCNEDEKTIYKQVLDVCNQQSVQFNDKQIESICQCILNPVTIITGGPGTGKTTLISMLCRYMAQYSKTVALAAPTGRAAKRMQETTGGDAKTIHRLLEIQYRSDIDDYNLLFARDKDNPIDADLVIIDETSMMDIFLMNHLLEAIKMSTRVVFVGDANQLPAVGAGNVLRDFIASHAVPVVELNKVYRQETGSLIVQNSHAILNGHYPIFDQTINSGFMMISKERDIEKAQSVISLCINVLPRQYNLDPIHDIQIMTPTRKGSCGTKELNKMLQEAFYLKQQNVLITSKEKTKNEKDTHTHNNRHEQAFLFHLNDKVMQIKNNYELKWTSINNPQINGNGIFNGDLGIVVSKSNDNLSWKVLFDDEKLVEYNRNNIEELDLAYAITVHKSQGSEYPVVVLVLPDAPGILMTRNLLYTAVSRAREKLFLVSNKGILIKMINNTNITKRNTLLESFMNTSD